MRSHGSGANSGSLHALASGVDGANGVYRYGTGGGFPTSSFTKSANQALAARRAGAQVRMAGAVGNDGFAEQALALLGAAGTDLSTVKRVAEPTGTALILVGGDGENMIAVVPGANGTMTAQDATATVGALAQGDILMLQLGADTELANPESDLRKLASSSTPEATLRRLQAIMHCRELLTLNVAPLLAVEEMALSLSEG